MLEITAKVSSKNQGTLPREVRRQLGIGANSKLAFVLRDDGTVEVRTPRYTLEQFFGAIPALPHQSEDFEAEIESAIAEEITRTRSREQRS